MVTTAYSLAGMQDQLPDHNCEVLVQRGIVPAFYPTLYQCVNVRAGAEPKFLAAARMRNFVVDLTRPTATTKPTSIQTTLLFRDRPNVASDVLDTLQMARGQKINHRMVLTAKAVNPFQTVETVVMRIESEIDSAVPPSDLVDQYSIAAGKAYVEGIRLKIRSPIHGEHEDARAPRVAPISHIFPEFVVGKAYGKTRYETEVWCRDKPGVMVTISSLLDTVHEDPTIFEDPQPPSPVNRLFRFDKVEMIGQAFHQLALIKFVFDTSQPINERLLADKIKGVLVRNAGLPGAQVGCVVAPQKDDEGCDPQRLRRFRFLATGDVAHLFRKLVQLSRAFDCEVRGVEMYPVVDAFSVRGFIVCPTNNHQPGDDVISALANAGGPNFQVSECHMGKPDRRVWTASTAPAFGFSIIQ